MGRRSLRIMGAALLAAVAPLVATAQATRPASVTVTYPDGSSERFVREQAPATPATAPTVPVVTPRTRPATVPDADALVIRVPAGGDLAGALARMDDGKTLALERGGRWTGTVQWRWSRATLTSYGDGPAPVIGTLKIAAPVADVEFRGFDLEGRTGYGLDARDFRMQRVRFADLAARGFSTCYSVHLPDLENVPADRWHRDVSFVNCRASGPRADDPADTFKGQGWYLANVDGLTIDGCHADDCGGLDAPNIFRHGWYVAAMNRRVVIRGSAGTRCSSYAIQCRAAGSVVEGNAAYDCGLGIMANGATGDVLNNVVVRGHGHAAPWTYGKGGFDLHLGGGTIAGNLVVNGPQAMPAAWFWPPAFNLGFRATKPDSKLWEWLRLDAAGNKRPLATLGAGNVDRSDRVATVNVAQLAAGPPAAVGPAIVAAARAAAK